MKRTFSSKRKHCLAGVSVFLLVAALIVGTVGCTAPTRPTIPPSQNLEIRTWYDLNAIRNNPAGNHTLMNDLDSTIAGYAELASPTANGGKGWEPIATYVAEGGFLGFMGSFDGREHEIRDLFINRPDEDFVGLFRYILATGEFGQYVEGVLRDVGVANATVTGKDKVGGLVGHNDGTVSNSYFIGNVTGGGYAVGGLVGLNRGTVGSSYFTGALTGDRWIGGLVGWNEKTVSNSYSTGSVTATGYEHVGGLVGLNEGFVTNSYSTGSVTGNEYVGGLVGLTYPGTVANSFWDTETSGLNTSDGGTGKITAQMQDITAFAGWDIVTVALNETNPMYIWNIVNNVTYPFLSWQAT